MKIGRSCWYLFLTLVLANAGLAGRQLVGSGDSPPFTFDRRVQPVVTSIQPTAGSTQGGTTITVSGDQFFDQHTWIKLGEVEIKSVTITSSNQLTFITPPRDAGKLDLEVVNTGGLTAKLSSAFRYEAPLGKKVEATAESSSLVANGKTTTQLEIKLFDQNGELVPDETVNLVVDNGQLAEQATNNADGTYSTTYTSATSPGQATIQAITTTSGKLRTRKLTLTPRQ